MTNTNSPLRVSSNHPSPRNEVIERCLPLVKSLTARLRSTHGLSPSFEDLYALGVDGLMQAAERFDPTRGVSFTTFAYHRIRGTILNWRRHDPERQLAAPQSPASLALPAIARLEPANDNASPVWASEAVEEPVRWVLSDPATVPFASAEEIEAVPDQTALHPDDEIERRRLADRVRDALAALPEVERRVIELHYYEDLSFSEIGAELDICKPWAFRLHNKAIRRLRESLGELAETLFRTDSD